MRGTPTICGFQDGSSWPRIVGARASGRQRGLAPPAVSAESRIAGSGMGTDGVGSVFGLVSGFGGTVFTATSCIVAEACSPVLIMARGLVCTWATLTFAFTSSMAA